MIDPLDGCGPEVVRFEYSPGKFCHIRELDGAGRDAYLQLVSAAAQNGMVSAGDIAALGIVRSETDHSLAYVTDEQKALLKSKKGEVLQAIALKLLQLSALRPKDVEEAEKKS
jgi:hypothetical protein